MFIRDGVMRAWRGVALAAVPLLALTLGAAPASAADALLYRIFLRDGSTLVSYGDFARVADRVVLFDSHRRAGSPRRRLCIL